MREFYRRIQFKTVVICDLSNPLIKRSDMLFNCDVCGRRAHRVSEWQLKNKSYRAEFLCRHCQHRFFGRVQFKLKYEGLIVKKYILPFREKPKDERPKRCASLRFAGATARSGKAFREKGRRRTIRRSGVEIRKVGKIARKAAYSDREPPQGMNGDVHSLRGCCWDCVTFLRLSAGKVGPVGKSGFAGDFTSPGKAGVIKGGQAGREQGGRPETRRAIVKISLSGKQAGNQVKQTYSGNR